jgi:hypothetical protein
MNISPLARIRASRLKCLRLLMGEIRSIIDSNHPFKDHALFITLCSAVAPFLLFNPSAVRVLVPFLIKQKRRFPKVEWVEVLNQILGQPAQAVEELVKIQESLSEEKHPILWSTCTTILSYFLINYPQNEPDQEQVGHQEIVYATTYP